MQESLRQQPLFSKLGYPVLLDDIACLVPVGREFMAQPRYPRLNLWSDSVHSLYGAPDALPYITKNWDKRYLDLGPNGRFRRDPAPLAGMYLLGERSDDEAAPFVQEIQGQEALLSPVANTYMNFLLDTDMRACELEALGRLAASPAPSRRGAQ